MLVDFHIAEFGSGGGLGGGDSGLGVWWRFVLEDQKISSFYYETHSPLRLQTWCNNF